MEARLGRVLLGPFEEDDEMNLGRKGWFFGALVLTAQMWSASAQGTPAGVKDRQLVKCHASVAVIGAVTKRAPFPKALAAWKKQLTRPPFSFFKGFALLKGLESDLAVGRKPFVAALAGPYTMELTLLGTHRTSKGKEQFRFRLKLMARRGKESKVISNGTMRLDRGGTFFVAGPKVGAQTLVLAITLK